MLILLSVDGCMGIGRFAKSLSVRPFRICREREKWYNCSMKEPDRTIRVRPLSAQGSEDDLKDTTPEERLDMMWQLAVDAWAFKGEPVGDGRLDRSIVRVVRGEH